MLKSEYCLSSRFLVLGIGTIYLLLLFLGYLVTSAFSKRPTPVMSCVLGAIGFFGFLFTADYGVCHEYDERFYSVVLYIGPIAWGVHLVGTVACAIFSVFYFDNWGRDSFNSTVAVFLELLRPFARSRSEEIANMVVNLCPYGKIHVEAFHNKRTKTWWQRRQYGAVQKIVTDRDSEDIEYRTWSLQEELLWLPPRLICHMVVEEVFLPEEGLEIKLEKQVSEFWLKEKEKDTYADAQVHWFTRGAVKRFTVVYDGVAVAMRLTAPVYLVLWLFGLNCVIDAVWRMVGKTCRYSVIKHISDKPDLVYDAHVNGYQIPEQISIAQTVYKDFDETNEL